MLVAAVGVVVVVVVVVLVEAEAVLVVEEAVWDGSWADLTLVSARPA